MFTFLSKKIKNRKNYSIKTLTKYTVAAFFAITALIFSWVFLFIYQHLYFAIIQETAFIKLKSQLVIPKIHRAEFNNLVKKFEEKQNPPTVLNLENLPNPFRSELITEKTVK